MIVLDTHVVVWVYLRPQELSTKALEALVQATSYGISTFTLWEIAMMARKNPALLKFPVPTLDWLQRLVAQERVRILPMTPEIAVQAVDLPMNHKDPADRVIMATAKAHNCSLVTKDPKILEANWVRTIW